MNIEDPKNYFEQLGDLHDVGIQQIEWRCSEKKVLIAIDDLNGSFAGLPEYPGCRPATITCEGISSVVIDIESSEERLNIGELTATSTDGGISIEVECWPAGTIKIVCTEIGLDG